MTQFRGAGASGSWAPKKRSTLAEWWAQTGTKRMIVDPIVSGLTLPGDVYQGKVDPRSDEAIERSFDLAGTIGLGAGAVPATGGMELRAGMKGTGGRLRQPSLDAQLPQQTGRTTLGVGQTTPPVRREVMPNGLPPSRAKIGIGSVQEFLDELGVPYRVEHSRSNTDTFGPSLSTYYHVETPAGKTTVRVSDHHVSSEPGSIGLGDDLAEAQASILTALGRDVPPEIATQAHLAKIDRVQAKIANLAAKVGAPNMPARGVYKMQLSAARQELKGLQSAPPFAGTHSAKAGIGPAAVATAAAATAMAPQESQAQSMPIRVKAPTGEIIEFPEGMSDAEINSVMQREFGEPEAPLADAKRSLSDLTQNPKVRNPSPNRGSFLDPFMQGLSLGTSDEIKGGVRAAVQAPFSDKTIGELYNSELEGARTDLNSYRDRHPVVAPIAEIGGAVTGVAATGGASLLPRAATTAGKIGVGALEGAGLGGIYGFGAGEGGAQKRLQGAGIGAATGAAGGMAGGAVAGALANRGARAAAPSVDDLKTAATAAYTKADQAGMVITPRAFDHMVDDIIRTAGKAGVDKTIHPKAWAALGRLFQARGSSPKLQDIDILRRVIKGAAASTEPDERRIASMMVDRLDDRLENLTPLHVSAGDPKAATAAITEARGLWSRMRKGEVIEDLVERAKTSAPNFSGSGMENALRTQFRQLANNKKAMRQFTMEEKAAILKVARGGPLENIMRMLGKFAPTGVVSAALSGGAGYMLGGQVGSVALPAMGFAARRAATGMTKRNAENVGNMVRAGGPVAPPPITAKQQALLNLLLGTGVSSGPAAQGHPLLTSGAR